MSLFLPVLAWRNLWRNKRRTLLTLTAITFGMFLAILMTSLQDEAWADMIDTAARMGGGHVSVQHTEYIDTPTLTRTVKGGSAIKALAEADPQVSKVVYRINGSAMVSTAHNNYGGFFVAYDPKAEDDSTLSFLEGIQSGHLLTGDEKHGIVLGKRLASNLQVELGDKVVYTMMSPSGDIVAGLGRLTGTVGTGADGVDGALVLLPINEVRELLGYEADESTHVAIFTSDSRNSAVVANRLLPQVAPSKAIPWFEMSPELSGFIAMKVGGARFFELIILLLVAASIFNTLFVSVIERSREFGILMAIGYSQAQIFAMVVWESLWLALVGVLASGAITYWPYSWLAENGIDISAAIADDPSLKIDVGGVGMSTVMKVGIFPENLAIIIAAVILSTLLAGLYPAWRASRVMPVQAIKLV
jgi:ABC-type lipoprotein release transport system permease subunit